MVNFNPNETPREIKDIFLDAMDYLRTTPKDFARNCGFRNTEKMYHITNGRNNPGYETLCAVVAAFPMLNGDRFLRGTGPILLEDLCKDTKQDVIVAKPQVQHSGDWQMVAEDRLRTIERLEKQLDFMQKLLEK